MISKQLFRLALMTLIGSGVLLAVAWRLYPKRVCTASEMEQEDQVIAKLLSTRNPKDIRFPGISNCRERNVGFWRAVNENPNGLPSLVWASILFAFAGQLLAFLWQRTFGKWLKNKRKI